MLETNNYFNFRNYPVFKAARRKIQEHPILSAVTAAAIISSSLYIFHKMRAEPPLQLPNEVPKQYSIVHLAQSHWVPALDYSDTPRGEDWRHIVWLSQKTIGQYLLSHPNANVFVEQAKSSSQYENLHEIKKKMGENFFQDPINFDTLPNQKKTLIANHGAAAELHYAGKLRVIRRTTSPEKDANMYIMARNLLAGKIF
jgi:hypothetical protein